MDWPFLSGYRLFKTTLLLWITLPLRMAYLLVGQTAVRTTAPVLIVATLIKGLNIPKVPLDSIRFIIWSFSALFGLMAPTLGIPEGWTSGLFFHCFQTAPLNYGLFLCVGGFVELLQGQLEHADAQVSFKAPAVSDLLLA